MKTATPFIKTVSVILLVCTLFSMCILTTSAEESTTPPENWKIDNGEKISWSPDGQYSRQYYTDPGFEYVYYYKGTADSELSGPRAFGFHSDFTEATEAVASRYVPVFTAAYIEGNVFCPQYHFALGVSYTCPYTGIIKFSFDYALANSDHQLLIGFENSFTRGDWDYFNDATRLIEYVDGTWKSSTMEFRVEAGDKIYFLVNNKSNGYASQLWINTVEYVPTSQATWKIDNGFASYSEMPCARTQYYYNDAFDYVYLYQGTDPSLSGTLSFGIYNNFVRDYTKYRMPNNTYSYYEGCVFAPQYHFCPGVSFEAPFTGTVKFDYWVQLKNISDVDHHVLTIGKAANYTRAEWNWFTDGIEWQTAKTIGDQLVQRSITVDMVAGEKLYFFIDNTTSGYESLFWIQSAEYLSFGDPTTVLGVQETKVTDGKFDVRLISALNSLDYNSVGFEYSVKWDNGGEIKSLDKTTVPVSTVYGKLIGNADSGIEEYNAPQNTYLLAGVLQNVPAQGTVEITFTSYANVKGKIVSDDTFVLTYVDGTFTSLTVAE